MVILNGFEYKNRFVQAQKLHLIGKLNVPGRPMATVILRDITNGTFYISVLYCHFYSFTILTIVLNSSGKLLLQTM